ncbi:PREDICTED: uncharacterized protein LOC109473434 [Branchiostoma belcheri]|uniref:Uncharacterized protein LOC109473434 n=1 Tax=Branchiostoma belcheri TaxID=7741 RepID=A0A6P4ZCM6_BRABE|nr:PREDICTED: uncharacterized protein LOC109473434 [Branchiostoma belcheri]
MEHSDSLETCFCPSCDGKKRVPARTAREHTRKAVQKSLQGQVIKEKPPIAVLLEAGEHDPRNGPVIKNGSSTKWTVIGFTAKVLEIRAKHPGVSQECVTAYFSLVKNLLDDHGIANEVPRSYKQAVSMVSDLLPKSETYDVCPNDCIMYRGEHRDAERCPICKEGRKDSRGKPRKEYHYFPLIPTIKTLYGVPEIARKLQEHGNTLKSEVPRFVRDIQDTKMWKEMYAEDGPFKMMVDEVLQMLTGVEVWDAWKNEYVTITADMVAFVFDWPGRCKCTYHQGARAPAACCYCQLKAIYNNTHRMTTFGGSRQFLPMDHPLRLDTDHFPEKEAEHRGPPPPQEDQTAYGAAVEDLTKKINEMKAQGTTAGIRALQASRKTMIETTGKTGREVFADLPTYSIDRVHIDWMHTAKNIIHNIFEVLTGHKHNFNEVVKMEKWRFPCRSDTVTGNANKRAREEVQVYQLNRQEMAIADERLQSIIVPVGYDFKVRPLFSKPLGMKTIEWILFAIDGILEYAVRGMLPAEQRTTIFRLCATLKALGSPVADMATIADLEKDVHETFSLVERNLPLAIKTLMVHLPHHMAPIIKQYGPLTSLWMMPYERYMQFVLRRMTNKSHPTKSAREAYKVHSLCNILQLAGKMPTTGPDPLEDTSELPCEKNEEDEDDDKEEGVEVEDVEENEVGVDVASAKLGHLKGTIPPSEEFVLVETDELYLSSHLSEVNATSTNARKVVKYLAASSRHPITNRLLEYRCEELETRRKARRISSIVGIKLGDVRYFGRIQYFLLVNDMYEMAYIRWYGTGEKDGETGLWMVEMGSVDWINPFQHFHKISKPLVHALEGRTLFILDLHSYDLA